MAVQQLSNQILVPMRYANFHPNLKKIVGMSVLIFAVFVNKHVAVAGKILVTFARFN